MERYQMVEKYNHFVAKRECYKSKLSYNGSLRSSLEPILQECINIRVNMSDYSDKSQAFDSLYDLNFNRYSTGKKASILAELDRLDTYINGEIANAQAEINYWDSEIKAYDAEQARKAAEEAKRKAEEEAAAKAAEN